MRCALVFLRRYYPDQVEGYDLSLNHFGEAPLTVKTKVWRFKINKQQSVYLLYFRKGIGKILTKFSLLTFSHLISQTLLN